MKMNMKFIVAEGESQRIEFKENVGNLDKEMVAMANAAGGSIFLGIDDNGDIRGIDISNRLLSAIQNIARNCDPEVAISTQKHPGNVLEIKVEEGENKPYRCRSGFFLRVGPNCQKLRRDEIKDFILAEGNFHFDETICKKFRFNEDFDPDKLKRYLSISNINTRQDITDILYNLDVATIKEKKFYLNNAGVLFFAKNPQKFLKESFLTCILYRGSERYEIIDRKDFYGDLITIAEESLQYLFKQIKVSYKISGSGRRTEIFEYPPVVVREAIINALTHRDYYFDTTHIYVHFFADRFEIENPGGLVKGLKFEDLGKRSIRRNRTIADLLYRAKYIERMGSGIERMRKSLEENNNPLMEIAASNYFSIRFYPRVEQVTISNLTERQTRLYQFISEKKIANKKECAIWINASEDTSLRELKVLMDKKLILREGIGKSTVYILNEET